MKNGKAATIFHTDSTKTFTKQQDPFLKVHQRSLLSWSSSTTTSPQRLLQSRWLWRGGGQGWEMGTILYLWEEELAPLLFCWHLVVCFSGYSKRWGMGHMVGIYQEKADWMWAEGEAERACCSFCLGWETRLFIISLKGRSTAQWITSPPNLQLVLCQLYCILLHLLVFTCSLSRSCVPESASLQKTGKTRRAWRLCFHSIESLLSKDFRNLHTFLSLFPACIIDDTAVSMESIIAKVFVTCDIYPSPWSCSHSRSGNIYKVFFFF